MSNCDLCGEGTLHAKTLHFSICDVCGSEQSNASQLRDNKRAEAEARKVLAQEQLVQELYMINGTLQEILMQLRQG